MASMKDIASDDDKRDVLEQTARTGAFFRGSPGNKRTYAHVHG